LPLPKSDPPATSTEVLPPLFVFSLTDGDVPGDIFMSDATVATTKNDPPDNKANNKKKVVPEAPKSYSSWTSALLEAGTSALSYVATSQKNPVKSSLQVAAAAIPSSSSFMNEDNDMDSYDELDDKEGEFLNYHVGAEDIRDMYLSVPVGNTDTDTIAIPEFSIENKNLRRRLNTLSHFMDTSNDKNDKSA
jgi:hypothetical protein